MTALDVREAPAPPKRTSAVRVIVVLALLGGALALLVSNLSESTTYFKTADEAVAEKSELGDRRFRVEGAVVTGSVRDVGDAVEFEIISAGEVVPVVHQGDPPELFKPGIPVVLEGRWDGDVYASDRIMVKHTTEYREQNPDRVDDYVGKERAPEDET
jgi:cytochrome c-type biogenesis protein CcmE